MSHKLKTWLKELFLSLLSIFFSAFVLPFLLVLFVFPLYAYRRIVIFFATVFKPEFHTLGRLPYSDLVDRVENVLDKRKMYIPIISLLFLISRTTSIQLRQHAGFARLLQNGDGLTADQLRTGVDVDDWFVPIRSDHYPPSSRGCPR
ncbi:hypothetical protein Fcan01_00032 [Folsomia candida]|uniref:Uncharacterized protein n=1 Tax=Folsomia candida TaxID=158441 RepID=A0A226EXM8_FOLCA|nr:hypothetical protein Fcan01_00032 [Folsomia candida]